MKFCNVPINIHEKKDFVDFEPKKFKHYCTLNAQFFRLANEDKKVFEILNQTANTLDGRLPHLLNKIVNKDFLVDKISGSDMIQTILKKAVNEDKKVYLLGGEEKYIEKTKNMFNSKLLDGFSPPFQNYPFEKIVDEEIKNKIRLFKPEIILVFFGAPKQEFWIYDNREWLASLGVKVAYGLGGSLEMIHNKLKKAPSFISFIGLEIIWRIIVDPFNKSRYKRLIYSFGFIRYI